jgi:ureidoacrylate peracid hydrolase
MSEALIVIDVQVDFCGPDCEPVAEVIERLIAAARRAGVPVIWVRTEHSEATDTAVWLSRRAGAERVCRPGTPGIEFFRVRPQPGEPVITKHRYSAFIGTDLEIRLRAMGVTELICCGVRTNVCVESTVRDAFQRDIATAVVADGCQSAAHTFHEAALRNIQTYFGRVLSSGEVLARWSAPTMAGQAVPSGTRAQP